MGLGGGPGEWDDYEWFRLADLAAPPPAPLTLALQRWAHDTPLWAADGGSRVLLVDLDNIRADPVRLRARLALLLVLARRADHAAFAGQRGAVLRSRPWLEEFGSSAVAVREGPDAADRVLLAAAAEVRDTSVQFVVASNDGIFASLAARGPVTLLSPGSEALSDRLRAAAVQVVDLPELEGALAVS